MNLRQRSTLAALRQVHNGKEPFSVSPLAGTDDYLAAFSDRDGNTIQYRLAHDGTRTVWEIS